MGLCHSFVLLIFVWFVWGSGFGFLGCSLSGCLGRYFVSIFICLIHNDADVDFGCVSYVQCVFCLCSVLCLGGEAVALGATLRFEW